MGMATPQKSWRERALEAEAEAKTLRNYGVQAQEEIERLRAHLVKYQCDETLINQELKDVRAKAELFKDAIEYAHAEGFEWPSDPFSTAP